jgi:PAS domain S-box-containing protein
MYGIALQHGCESEDTPNALAPDFVASLLDHMPEAPFWVKDSALRYVSVNAAMLELCGVRASADVIGRTARDFFAESVRERHEAQDRLVMRTRRSCADQLELCSRLRGEPVWLLIRRRPVTGAQGRTIGVAAIARRLDPNRRHPTYARLAFVIDHIDANFRGPVDLCELARRCEISLSQLNRDFISLLGLPPKRYLMKVRFEAAVELLESGMSIVEVAHASGYTDQSAFARSFRLVVGISPSAYRRARLVEA